jgi:hypothetical protein
MVKAEFPIGKTQWAKWGDEAREAYNRVRRQGFTHETGVAEANAVQAKASVAAPEEPEEVVAEEVVPEKPVANHKPRTVKRKQGK